MRARASLSLVGALVAAVALVSASGAATAKAQKATRLDVSSRASIVHYLRSIHVAPKGVVVQRGTRNYAGAHCPGKGWTCTSTTHPVVQVAGAGGTNAFRCSTASCAVVQVANAPASPNTAKCIRTSGLGQSCTISQSSSTGDNLAVVYEKILKTSGLVQTALSTASVTQQATAGNNAACVHQEIVLEGSTNLSGGKAKPINVALEAHQSVSISQDAPHGTNSASQDAGQTGSCAAGPLNQSQSLASTAGGSGASSVTQNENDVDNGPNMTLDIEQNQGSGFGSQTSLGNDATFAQTNELSAVGFLPAGSVSQTQSSQHGGILAKVNQDAHGVSSADANQQETQCEDAYKATGPAGCSTTEHVAPALTLSQTQTGPVQKAPGDSRQTGNSNDSFTVTQGSQQDSDTGSTQTNLVAGGFHTDGTGTVDQTTTVDGQTSTDTQTGSGDVSGTVNCTGSTCTSTPPPPPTIDSNPPNPDSSPDATFEFSDADPSATFLCQLDGGGYSSCDTPKTYNALDPGSHTFSVEAKNPTTGAISDPTSYPWTISSGNANVLIAGAGDETIPSTEANDNIVQALTAAGYSVTELASLPADLSSYGQVWWVDTNPPTSAEQQQLIDFAQSGKGVFLTGENDPCCALLNAADQSMVNSIVTGGGVTVGGQDVCCVGTPIAYSVNPGVVGNLATQPHTLTSWTATYPGAISGLPDSSVFAYYQPGETKQVVAGAWDRASVTGEGRLAVLMDINWAQSAWSAPNWSDVAENVAFFLSGLDSPPIILFARQAAPPFEPGQVTPRGGSSAGTVRSGPTSDTK